MLMNKIVASLLCYSLTIPLFVNAVSSPTPSSKRYKHSDLAQSSFDDEPKPSRRVPERKKTPTRQQKKSPSAKTAPLKRTGSSSRPQAMIAVSDDEELPVTPIEPTEECEKGPNHFRFSTSHTENKGIGYNQGYTSLDMFFNWVPIYNMYPFFDLRGHVSNDGHPSANIGAGIRYLPNNLNVVLGLNVFYDFRKARHVSFQQIGCGIEILGTQWKFNANGYLPIIQSSFIRNREFDQFSGHQALLHINREIAMKGADANIGRSLIHRGFYTLDAYVGGYYFQGDRNLNTTGGYGRLRSNLSRFITLELQGSYDTLFKRIIQGTVGLNFPVGKRVKTKTAKRTCYQKIALERNLTDPVSRFEMIVTHLNQQTTQAIDPFTGSPLNIVFVNQDAPEDGDGTAEHPYKDLAIAQTFSKPTDMIYVYPGYLPYSDLITLQNQQWLQGSATSFTALSKYGPVQIPAQTRDTPNISNQITLANDNIVQGFQINSAVGDSIYGLGIQNATINDNIFISQGDNYCYLEGSIGLIKIGNNQGTGAGIGIEIENPNGADFRIANNSFSNKSYNILINSSSDRSFTALIRNNLLQSANTSIVIAVNANQPIGCFDILDNNIIAGYSTIDFNGYGTCDIKVKRNQLTQTETGFYNTQFYMQGGALNITFEKNQFNNSNSGGIYFQATPGVNSVSAYVNDNKSSEGALLNMQIDAQAQFTGYIYNNKIDNTLVPSCIEIIFGVVVSSSVNSTLILSNNQATSAFNGIEITTFTDTTLDLNLTGNNMNVAGIGYSLSNQSTRNFWLQSPNLQLSGVEKINTGSFVVDGITYTTYSPPPTNP